MQKHEGKLIATLDQVDEFLKEHDDLFGTTLAATAHQGFAVARQRVDDRIKVQDASGRLARTRMAEKEQLKNDLIDGHMRPVALMARSVLEVNAVPAAFLLPTRNGRSSAIIAAGYGMAEAAKQHEAAFAAAGLRADFISALVGATDAVRDAVKAKAQTIALRMEATAGLRQDARAARRYLRVLDALVRTAIGSDEGLLARWLKVSRVDSVGLVPATQPVPVVEGPSDVPVDAPVGGPADAPVVVGTVAGQQPAAVAGPTQVQAAA